MCDFIGVTGGYLDASFPRCSRNIVDSIRLRTRQQFCCTDRLRDVHLRDSLADTDRLYMSDLKGHFGCVNALCFSNNNQEYLASGRLKCT